MATVTWLGKRQITRYSRPYTAGGTTTGVYGFTINGKTVSITGDGGTPTTQAESLVAACEASTEPEFAECDWTSSGAVITVTGPADGAPITISTSVSGSATLTAGSATSAVSPNDLNDAANYSGGALPSNSDTVVFPPNSANVIYNLDAFTSITGLTIVRQAGGPLIGLQDWKQPGYREYRQTSMLLGSGGSVNLDLGDESGYRVLRFDLKGAGTNTALIVGANPTLAGQESVELIRPGTLTASINGGSVAITPGSGGSLGLASLKAANATASVGTGITTTTLDYQNANGIVESDFTTLRLNGGVVEVRGTATGTPTIDAGVLSWKTTGTLTNCEIGSGGVLDTSAGVGSITVSGSIVRNEGGSINDPTMRLARSYSVQHRRTSIGGGAMNLGEHLKTTIADY